MSPVLSKPTPVLDGSAAGFRRAAGDLGEAIAVLSGGLPPDQWTRSRLAQALAGYPQVQQPYYERSCDSWIYPTTVERRPYLVGADGGFLLQNAGAAAA